MLVPPDLLSLPCTSDLIESGIACACRSLAHTGGLRGSPPVESLRCIVAEVAVELAFRRYLRQATVPFGVLAATPFTDPDHYDISLGGHRCTLESTLVSRSRPVSLLRRERGLLLQAPALIPLDRFSAGEGKPDDIHLFAYLLGGVAASQRDVDQAQTAGQPVSLIHSLPAEWARPSAWVPLEKLVLKSECELPVTLELNGQDADRNFITRTLELPPRTRVPIPDELYSVICLRLARRPAARIGIHSPLRGEACLVSPFEWGSLWIYGMEILLAGWLTRENYRRKAVVLNPGMRTMLSDRRREKNLLVPVEDLNPLAPLLSKVKAWAAGK
jgi:hypothetical protein